MRIGFALRQRGANLRPALGRQRYEPSQQPRPLALQGRQAAARTGCGTFRTHPIEARRDPGAFAHVGKPRKFPGRSQIAAHFGIACFDGPPVDHARRNLREQRVAHCPPAGIRGIDPGQCGAFLRAQATEQVEVPARREIGRIGYALGVERHPRRQIATERGRVGARSGYRGVRANIGQALSPRASGSGTGLFNPRRGFCQSGRGSECLSGKRIERRIVDRKQSGQGRFLLRIGREKEAFGQDRHRCRDLGRRTGRAGRKRQRASGQEECARHHSPSPFAAI